MYSYIFWLNVIAVTSKALPVPKKQSYNYQGHLFVCESRMRLDLIRLLQKHSREQFITVAMVNSIRRCYRGRLDRVRELFDLAVEYGAGEIQGPQAAELPVLQHGGPRSNPLRLRLTLGTMTQKCRDELKILVGSQGLEIARMPPGPQLIDFGGVWQGMQHACAPLHLAISMGMSALSSCSKNLLTEECWRIATAEKLPLDITPLPHGAPQTLRKLHALLSEAGATLQIHYVSDFGQSLRHTTTLGYAKSGCVQLPPLVVSLVRRHCCLGIASAWTCQPQVATFFCLDVFCSPAFVAWQFY